MLKILSILCVTLCCFIQQSVAYAHTSSYRYDMRKLRSKLQQLANNADGIVGIAVISPHGDTLSVNNDTHYPLMSVFKLHQALAVAYTLDSLDRSIDTILSINKHKLDQNTWSPMLKTLPDTDTVLSVRTLLKYSLQYSDNNASNILFDRITSVAYTDQCIRKVLGIHNFKLAHTEADMKQNHELSRNNWSSPMDCAVLIRKVFTDNIVSEYKQQIISKLLQTTETGKDRLYVPLENHADTHIAHKTGSGYRTPEGLLMAHNDIGHITLPCGCFYSIAVLVTDFKGSEQQASNLIAHISTCVYNFFTTP